MQIENSYLLFEVKVMETFSLVCNKFNFPGSGKMLVQISDIIKIFR